MQGAAACKHIFGEMKIELDKPGAAPTLSALEVLQRFQWLLPEDDKKELARWVLMAVAQAKRKGGIPSIGRQTPQKKQRSSAASSSAQGDMGSAGIWRYFK